MHQTMQKLYAPIMFNKRSCHLPLGYKNKGNKLNSFWRSPLPIEKYRKIRLGASSMGGFKKQLFNHVMARDDRLYPTFNRRKHSHSYHLIVFNQLRKLGKVFQYLSVNKIDFYIGAALKSTFYQRYSRSLMDVKRSGPNLISVIETDTAALHVRNQFYFSLLEARMAINHSWFKPRVSEISQIATLSFKSSCPTQIYKYPKHRISKQVRWITVGHALRDN